MMDDEEFIEVKCPVCHGPALYNVVEDEIICSRCNKVYIPER